MKTTLCPIRSTIALIGILLLVSPAASADTIILKNGTRYQGRIVKEEGDRYLLQIQVTPSIKDERWVAKADVEKFEKENVAAAEFAELKKLTDTPDLLDVDDYEVRIRKLRAFIDQHRTAKESTEAEKLIKTLEAERDTIAGGAIKLNGRIIPPGEMKSDAIGIDAAIMGKQFERAAAGNNLLEAVRLYEKLETNFMGTTAQAAALPVCAQLLGTYQAQINRSVATLDARLKERDIGLERMPAADRERAKRIFAQQADAFAQQTALEKEQGTKWLSVDPFDKTSLDSAQRRIDTELKRLERPVVSRTGTKAPDEAYRDAWAALEGARKDEVRKIMSDLARLRLPEKYTKLLEERAAAVSATEEEDAK